MSSGVPTAQDGGGLPGLGGGIGGDTGVKRLSLADGGLEGPEGLLERRVGVEAVRVENVHIVHAHPLQALVEAGQQVLARSPLAIGAGPHVVTGLGGDDELVP